jgi:hypothetical protein
VESSDRHIRPRHIGVDLHKWNFVACFIEADNQRRLETYPLTRDGLSRFLKLGWLPEVPVPSEQVRTLRPLLQARETPVSMRTKLKNMTHAAFSRNGIALTRAAFASATGRERLARRDDLPPADLLVLRAALRQVEQLDSEIKAIEEEEVTRRSWTLKGRKRLRTVCIQAVLAMVNRTETPLMGFYQKRKREKGAGKAICATARKLLTIIFVLLKKGLDYWYLEDRLYNRKLRALDAAA